MKYRIRRSIENASGFQSWTIDAATPEEAIVKHNAGGGDFEEEEVEVTSLGEPEVEEMEGEGV